MRRALAEGTGSDVPCGGCTACCRAAQFVPVGPDEHDARAHIPADLLFDAPLLPPGHVLLGYDRAGHCPMLGDAGCTIYDHRPRACRTYDCRVFPAAGVGPDDPTSPVARQAARWRFESAGAEDDAALAAVRAAARFLERHDELLDEGRPRAAGPPSPTRVAVRAVELAEAFLRRDVVDSSAAPTGAGGVDGPVVVEPTVAEVRVALAARRGPAPSGAERSAG
jgi:Fe-S-cluster containining protein